MSLLSTPIERVDRRALTPTAAIALLEDGGYITPKCAECRKVYADAARVAERLAADPRWRPSTSHATNPSCLRSRQPHCVCGPCTGRAPGRRR